MKNPKELIIVTPKATYILPTYEVTDEGLKDSIPFELHFCKGNKADRTVFRQPGFFTESLLQACLQYLQENNVGELANRDTSIAITHIEDALLRLEKRANDRQNRGVQGTYQK